MSTEIADKFRCIQGCSDCCINRQYYPSEKFGKIGVLLLPDEVPVIEEQARKIGVPVRILPRIATGSQLPDRIIAYQMMGKNDDGDLCPFLDTASDDKSPHGGFPCMIYDNRPRACRAYPVVGNDNDKSVLDGRCKYCREFSTTTASSTTTEAEIRALGEIKESVKISDHSLRIWRYATATGRSEDEHKMLSEGWVIEE